MVVNAVLESEKPAIFQPVSITYERIVEENSYSRELRGGDKRRESLQSLLSSASLLTSRYGTVSLQFGTPIVLSDFEEAASARTSPPKRRSIIQSIAAMTMREINKVTTVSAAAVVAMVLLTHEGRGLSFADLLARANTVAGHLDREGARFAPGLLEDAQKLNEAKVRAALWLYVSAGHVELQVPGRTIHSAEERKAAWVNAEPILVHMRKHGSISTLRATRFSTSFSTVVYSRLRFSTIAGSLSLGWSAQPWQNVSDFFIAFCDWSSPHRPHRVLSQKMKHRGSMRI